jgi:DNA-binding response OmpR family regulator
MDGTTKGLVLLAEDDPDQSELLIELLQNEGFQVLHAENSLQVVRHLTEQPDVVLLDLVGVSSPAVFSAVDAMYLRPALVLLSADSRLAERAQAHGADAYLSKPYDLAELLNTMREALEGRRLAQELLHSAYV